MRAEIDDLLVGHGVMTLATAGVDGWPQATTVGYCNDGLILYFLISRSSRKFANIAKDERVAATIASEPSTAAQIRGLSISARVLEVLEEPFRAEMLDKLHARHPDYFGIAGIDWRGSALMRLTPCVITLVDFSKGLGHEDILTVGVDEILEAGASRPANWGPGPAARPAPPHPVAA